MKLTSTLALCFIGIIFITHSHAAERPALFLDGKQFASKGQFCWYDDKRYSEGAVIIAAKQRLVCAAKQLNYNNSELSWLPQDENGNIVYPKQSKSIRVN
ncbi:DUF1496 domain-containing protein [Pseudoalteromonas mariniglutinosa]|uniref:DUF1496 domain-containing protein n=1 Tax=Pseudoalteromonas mariniglutinosa TaxID=206042 RepID=UPI00384FFA90